MPSPAEASMERCWRIRRSRFNLSLRVSVTSCIWATRYKGLSCASRTSVSAQKHPDRSTALVDVALLRVEVLDLTGQHAPGAFDALFEVVGMGDALKVCGEQLLLGVAGDLAHRRVDLQPLSIRGQDCHAERRGPESGPKPLLALP